MSKNRELIILPKVNQAQLSKFLPQLENEGIKTIYLDPKKLGKKKTKLQTVFPSNYFTGLTIKTSKDCLKSNNFIYKLYLSPVAAAILIQRIRD